MARYAQRSDILVPKSTLVSLTNEDNTSATTIDEDVLIKALDQAQSEADSFIGAGRYVTPLEIVIPTFLRQLVARLAVYYLYLNKQQKIPESVDDGYERDLLTLREIGSGKRSLGTSTEDQSEAAGAVTAQFGRS